MELRNKETGAVITDSEFRALNPNTSFSLVINYEEWGYDVVLEGPQAQPTRYQVAYRDGIQEIDGQWFTKYSVADMDDDAKKALDEQQAKNVREDRNKRLAECDWTQLSDSPEADKAAWVTYRQALRDVPTQTGFPWEMQWPNKPE